MFAGEIGDFDYFMSSLYSARFGEAARRDAESHVMPELLRGRPPEPFEGARRKFRTLIMFLKGAVGKQSRATASTHLGLTQDKLAQLLRVGHELDPRYEVVEDDEGLSVQDRTMLHAEKLRLNPIAKEAIGRQAALEVEAGDLVLIDGGTTTLDVARALVRRRREERGFHAKVITDSVEIAKLIAAAGMDVSLVGGDVRQESLVTFGNSSIVTLNTLLDEYRPKARRVICFVGATGISLQEGFCVRTPLEKTIKASLVEASDRKYVVADTTKFRLSYRNWHAFYPLHKDVTVITEETEDPPAEFQDYITLLLAEPA